jgi:hypothetical protein
MWWLALARSTSCSETSIGDRMPSEGKRISHFAGNDDFAGFLQPYARVAMTGTS